jgi:hypothetical protein
MTQQLLHDPEAASRKDSSLGIVARGFVLPSEVC